MTLKHLLKQLDLCAKKRYLNEEELLVSLKKTVDLAHGLMSQRDDLVYAIESEFAVSDESAALKAREKIEALNLALFTKEET